MSSPLRETTTVLGLSQAVTNGSRPPHFSFGSRKSRNASPNMFTARIVIVIATPGNATIHHGGLNASASTPPSMLPQLGVGGGTPTPTKESAASMKIAAPRWPVVMTRNGATHWG